MHLTLYQTAQRLYAVRQTVGREGQEEFRVLKLDRTSPTLDACEDPTPYTKPQIQRLLAAIHAGNRHIGGLQLVCDASAIVGVVQLLEGPYLLLVTRRRYLGAICGHKVYGIDATALLPILCPATHRAAYGTQHASTAEQRYRKLLAGVQLTKDFFFSYSWPVHQTAQRTFAQPPAEEWDEAAAAEAFEAKSVWNEFLSRPLREALGDSAARWVVPLAHGFFQQRPLALLGRTLHLTLVARRSRQFAGTRYLKRGVTDAGYCANDVEVEQMVEAGVDWKSGQPLVSSMVQVRGSIPLHWAQQPDSSIMKPEILLHRFDPLYAATRRHFDQLREQYGEPVCVLDLVKRVERRPRESVLGREYATAIRFLNQRLAPGQQRVQYQAFDLSHRARIAKTHLLSDLQRLQEPVLAATGIFVSVNAGGGGGRGGGGSSAVGPAREQRGVLRTNCIDSLDRTNVGQFTHGMLALGQQLHALGISETAWLDPNSSLARHLMDAYEAMGHTLALQYGGSEAHSTFFQRQRGDWEAATQSRDLLTTVRRFYSNAYTDAEKQDGVNLFLGVFQPAPGKPHLWELGGDSYLHTVRGRNLGRTSSIGSRSSSFSVGHAGMAAAADTAQALASFPPPQSPAQPMQGRLGSPPLPTESEAESEAGGGLPESLSAASLVSLSSDGSFAPTLMALVEGASPQPPQLLSAAPSQEIEAAPAAEEVAADEPGTPKGGSDGADGVGAAGSSSAAAAAQPGGAAPIPTPPVRPGPKRSPLLSSSHRAAKLESFDKMLSRQPVAHVRLTAPDRPSKPSALGWLSPSKASQQAAAGKEKLKPAAAAAVAAAAATVAAAGVEAAGPGVCIPRGGLQRSNSDPSMASSLGPVPLPVPAPAAAAGAPRGRRVTFDGSATVLGPAGAGVGLARHSAGGGGLLRHSTAPSGTLSQLAEAAAAGGLGPALSGCGPGQVLLLMEPASDLAGGGMRRRVSYHSLAGLNLEGAAAAEASIKQGAVVPVAQPSVPSSAKPTRRLRFASFARLRAFARKGSPGGGGSGGAAVGGLSRSASEGAPSLQHPSPSLLGPRPSFGGAGLGGGAPEPLSMSAVVFGAEAVRRGFDSLGMAASPVSSWWLTGADPLAAMIEEQQRLHEQIARQREALATPLDQVEQRALLDAAYAMMRPSWAFNPASFMQGALPAASVPPPPTPSVGPPPAAPPVPQQGLAF